MTVRFSQLNTWYEIRSFWEGNFLERVAPGSFAGANPEEIRSLFNHGHDFQLGGKALGVPTGLDEAGGFARLTVPLLDTTYVRDLLPGLRAGAYGSSFMFDVTGESWDWEPEASDENPQQLPERTILSVRLYEAGPVTWPANPGADVQFNSAQQSGTDWHYSQLEKSGRLVNGDELRAKLRSVSSGPKRGRSRVERCKLLREMEVGQ
jgi:phage head maturation protease